MSLKLYNTLTRKQEALVPLHDNEFRMYSCGPTVYNFAHIGNFRAYICVDILKRYLRYKGFKVKHIMNLTDVDDKTIRDSQKEGVSLKEFTERYSKAFFEDLDTLNIDRADLYPKATEHIPEMIGIVEALLKNGIAYKAEDGIYFNIANFKGYGKLSHTKLEGLESGARVKQDEYDKENAQDFALWKFWDEADGDVKWDAPFGAGRPGWHLECSAMASRYLGQPFDIHAGGVDLIFPHHENEIAQSEGCCDKEFARHWFHNEHLLVEGKKMSKSEGNFFTLRDLLDKGMEASAIRYVLLSAHYRTQLNFTEESVEAAKNSIQRLQDLLQKLKEVDSGNGNNDIKNIINKTKDDFEAVMDDDLNISEGLAVIFEFVKEINTLLMDDKIGKDDAALVVETIRGFDAVLGVLHEEETIPKEIAELAEKRVEARKNKDFETADSIRKKLHEKGYAVEDTKEDFRVKKL